MNEREKQLVQSLINLMGNPAYFEFESHSIVEEMKKCDDPSVFVEPLFMIMEAAPLYDFGRPGSIVHLIESTSGYDILLLESLRKNPSKHGLLLLNRILNNPTRKNRVDCLNVLSEIMERTDIHPAIIDDATKKLFKHNDQFKFQSYEVTNLSYA